ncbi:sensor histidine kinase [Azohydromonas lata]|uniref:sensor histidine kinase n=1 Tax=Azohydromonas lata TaxID=45677 RepID=UPI00082E6C69|nr:ATP-binding protein [Azohydromonas lata]
MSTAVSPATEHDTPLHGSRREPMVLAFGALLIVALTVAAALVLWRAREDSLDTWRLYMENFSATAAEHASQTLRSADYALGSVVDHVQSLGVDSPERLREVARTRPVFEFIRERAAELPLLDVAAIVALDGEVLNFSRTFPAPAINLADRDYLQAHLSDPALTLFVSSPVKNRGTGRWTFYLARKIRTPAGQTIGLALAGIQSSYFERFYRSINLSEDDTAILLLRSDGTLLARHPPRPQALGQSYREAPSMRALTQARAEGRSAATVQTSAPRTIDPSDTLPRMVTAHGVEGFPLAVSITTREQLMLAPWRRTAWLCALGVLLLDAAIAGMTIKLYLLLRRRHAALRQLDAARAAAEAAAAEKSRFLANLSHEVRTPLHGLLGMAQRMLQSPLQPAQRQQAQIIERTGRLVLGSIDEVLDFSHAAAGQPALEPVPVDLARLGRDCIALFEPQARLKGVVLHLDMDDGGRGSLVSADPLRLSQVVNLLLSNAVKFTSAGGVTLRIAHTGAGLWRLSVHDTGTGLTRRQHETLFEPNAPDGAAPRSDAALGEPRSTLGLSTVQSLVLLLGGTVHARSTPGQGSEFWCELPLESLDPHTGIFMKKDIEELLDQRDEMKVVQ